MKHVCNRHAIATSRARKEMMGHLRREIMETYTLVHRRTKAKPGPMAKVLQIPEQVRPFWSDEEREEEGERESARERV